ncbi:PASTA domain-containing protein [Actinoplanes solisilvae]|uniref:PASTA domain-containing protein n=1 Tax=Actinoplanes solisilvae TaxID=2486853 RepID=UPI0013E32903|nr:PASTA domain-containing protein [Actinoplanes solisilvae]
MSDESDETRRFSSGDDAPGEPRKKTPGPDDPDATQVGDVPPDVDAVRSSSDLDATQVDGVPAAGDDDTLPGQGDETRVVPPVVDDATVVQDRLGSTAVIPPVDDDDWAPSRGNPAWSGRAEVRPPQPTGGYPEAEWPAGPPRQRDRWWMPIVVGIIALLLLAVLGWAIWLLVRDTEDDRTPAPVATTSTTPSSAPTTSASPSSSPTSTSASPSPSPTTPSATTPSPTATEVQIPALRGLSLADAQVALRSTGLNYRLIYRQAPDVPPGTVIDSDPVEGQEVPPDTTITLVIAAEATTPPPPPTDDAGDGQN